MIGAYETNQIYTGNVVELSQGIPDGCATLAFADPPYWVGFKYNGVTDAQMDYIDPAWLAGELQRIGKVAMITPSIGHMWEYPKPRWIIAWHKPNAMGRNVSGGVNAWEPIFIYGKTKINTDTLTALVGREYDAKFHSCPKPLALMLKIIEYYTEPDDLVIDLMCGSATTLVAAKMLGRRWLGFELDAEIAELARQRVANAQPPLIVPPTAKQDALLSMAAD